MPISRAEIQDVALLARLELTEPEIERLTHDLSAILAYVEQLGELDTTGVEPTTHAVPLDCPLRPDELEPSLPTAAATAAAPAAHDGFFGVPAILDAPEPAK
ncbi:MAG TPA: Asp-tRNA(Asn)/Glu-tRNA(Gln) amidotransferase subunit GatC [Polyangia bacterium]|jgi:aspartyl-tRNA(Asn)/glutamyl-tRNA(Gln) amidotransferase subunit C